MSLNFVSTSVLSSKDGISHDTETSIQPKNSASSIDRTHAKPLYEQLRENAQKEQEKYDEVTKAMQGTTTLNEDDVAYIQSIEDRKAEVKYNVKRKEEEEVQMFRAARLEKSMIKSELIVDEHEHGHEHGQRSEGMKGGENKSLGTSAASSSFMNLKPKIIKKRRRKEATTATEDAKVAASIDSDSKGQGDQDDNLKSSKRIKGREEHGNETKTERQMSCQRDHIKNQAPASDEKPNALAGLLAYGSDSDSD